MPAALAVDWNEVKTLALAIGVREAARQMQIPEGAVMQRSKREGWLVQQRATAVRIETARAVQRIDQGLSATPVSAADALARMGGNTRAKLASVVQKAAERLDQMDGDELMSAAVSDVASKYTGMAAKVHGWDGEGRTGGATVVNIAFLSPPAHDMPIADA